MRKVIEDRVEECIRIAETFYGKNFPRPSIIFKRKGTCGGYYDHRRIELMFQLDLAENNKSEYLNQIIPHEVAHLIQRTLYPYSKSHGKEWQGIMRNIFQLKPDVCHSMDISVTKTKSHKTYDYECGCAGKTHVIKKITHNRIQKNLIMRKISGNDKIFPHVFICKHCRNIITHRDNHKAINMIVEKFKNDEILN